MKKQIVSYTTALSLTCVLSACGMKSDNNTSTSTPEQEVIKTMPETQDKQGATKAMSVVTHESGLKKEVLQAAAAGAKSPQRGNKVTVHYTGWLEENGVPGKKFDSSVDRGQKFVFTIGVGQVIKGWDEGVMTMKVGEKSRFTIPAAIGYGARGAGAAIPPNATLIFDVELFDVA